MKLRMQLRQLGMGRWFPPLVGFLIALFVASDIIFFRAAGNLQWLELKAYDIFSLAALQLQKSALPKPSDVVIVGFDEDDVTQTRWPLDDNTLDRLLEKLLDCHPSAIGIDILRDKPVPDVETKTGSARLQKRLTDNKNIIAIMESGPYDEAKQKKAIAPPAALDKPNRTDQVGFNDQPLDSDEMIRRAWIFMPCNRTEGLPNTENRFSFAFRLASTHWALKRVDFRPERYTRPYKFGDDEYAPIQLDKRKYYRLAPDEGGYVDRGLFHGYQFFLDFREPAPKPRYTVSEILDRVPTSAVHQLREGVGFNKRDFEHKIVLIGYCAPSIKDNLNTPWKKNQYGVQLHAVEVEQILDEAASGRSALRAWSEPWENGWIILWALVGSAIGLLIRGPWKFAVSVVAALFLLCCICLAVLNHRVWIPVVPPVLALFLATTLVVSYVSFIEKRDFELLMTILARVADDKKAAAIWANRKEILANRRIKPQFLTATVLFTDLKGFATVADNSAPDELIDWMNEYMEPMTDIIAAKNGMVDSYIGDAIMALFGVPVPRTTLAEQRADAINAVETAVLMREKLIEVNQKWEREGKPTIAMRVGIYTGTMVAGGLGSPKRWSYAVIGNTVNVASRLESHDKTMNDPEIGAGGCRILIGHETYVLVANQFKVKKLGEIKVKSIEGSLRVYGVVGRAEPSVGGGNRPQPRVEEPMEPREPTKPTEPTEPMEASRI